MALKAVERGFPVFVGEKDHLEISLKKTIFCSVGQAEDEGNDLDSVPGTGRRPDFIRSSL